MTNKELAERELAERIVEQFAKNFRYQFTEEMTADFVKQTESILSEYQGEAVGYGIYVKFSKGEVLLGNLYDSEKLAEIAIQGTLFDELDDYRIVPLYLSAPIKKENE